MISSFPSPVRSPATGFHGPLLLGKSTLASKEAELIIPAEEVFLNRETEFPAELPTIKSGLWSPSRSAHEAKPGYAPVAKSTSDSKEPDVIEPGILMFLKMETRA